MMNQIVLAHDAMRASQFSVSSKVKPRLKFIDCHLFVKRFGSRALLTGLLVITAMCFPILPAYAGKGEATTTALTLSASSVLTGQPVLLTATVTGSGAPITKGKVTFCDATAALCDGAAVLATAQVTSASTASAGFYVGAGTYSIVAEFSGYRGVGGSTSAAQTLTVVSDPDNPYPSSSKISASGTVGNYILVGSVTTFGKPPLNATVSFIDTTNNDVVAGAAPLDPASLTRGFKPSPSSPIKGEPSVAWVLSGDFDEDGIPDIAILNGNAKGTVGIALGDGQGGFGPVVNYNAGAVPETMAVADLNGDGHLDLVVTDFNSSLVSVLLGNGDGTFKTATTFPSASPFFVAVADLNNDGVSDLVVSNGQSGTVSVFIGNGDGTFATGVTYPVGNSPRGIAIGDFNHDGVLDLAVSSLNAATVSILLGNGDGTFGTQQLISTPGVSYYPAVGDLRQNGVLDLIVPSAFSSRVFILLGNNDGTFQTAVPYAVAAAPRSVSLGDINNDGILDLVVPDTGADGLVSILIGNGDGTFAIAKNFAIGNSPINAALADFNGDGLLDVGTSDQGSRTATVLLQQITETATATGVAVYGSGTDTVLASYPGDAGRASSQSTTVPLLTVHSTDTATTVVSSQNPASFGQSITLSATIAPTPTVATGVSSGTISFYDGAILLGAAPVASGVAAFATMALPVGADSITASYSGNPGFSASTSVALIETVTPAATTTTLSATPNPAASGQSVTPTATITPAPTGTPTGTVNFFSGGTLLGNSAVNNSGTAAFTSSTLPVGPDSITASYSGNSSFSLSSSAALIETVKLGVTTTTLSASPSSAASGQSVTLTATVTTEPTGTAIGTVNFFSGGTLLGNSTVNNSGTATFTTVTLPVGADSITAVYLGDVEFGTSTSTPVTLNISNASTYTISASTTPFILEQGGSVNIPITIPPLGGSYNSVVTLSVSGLPPGALPLFNPPTAIPASAGAQSVLTLQLPAKGQNSPAQRPKFPSTPLLLGLVFTLFYLAFAFTQVPRRLQLLGALVGVAGSALLIFGCSGGFTGGPSTPLGTYKVTITGTSGPFHPSTTVTVIVK
jgi:Bacterial Ig-like domain (group 3)/FG-GAP-like repeat